MPELHFPWLETGILVPALGALLLAGVKDGARARWLASWIAALTLVLTVGEWIDFVQLHQFAAHDRGDWIARWVGAGVVVVDELSAPLLPLVALLHLVVVLSTPLSKAQRFSFPMALACESLMLATFSCQASWLLVLVLVGGTIPPWLELRRRGRSGRVFLSHMGLYAAMLVAGWALQSGQAADSPLRAWGGVLLAAACLLRSGIVPVHCWMTDLFEKGTFGMAILFVAPLPGAWGIMRMVLPTAPVWALQAVALVSLLTAVYAAGMALVQTEARRFFCYLFLSHSSLVLVGLELATPLGLAGALSVWLSASLSLTGFGIVLRCVESRIGRVSLADYHGLFAQMPTLAGFFLLTGLASIGFPGTVGFIAMELLVEGVVEVWPLVGMAVVLATGLNGIGVLQVWFRVFTGRNRDAGVSLSIRLSERTAVMLLTILILGGGLVPQPGLSSRYHAARELLRQRTPDAAPAEGAAAVGSSAAGQIGHQSHANEQGEPDHE